MISMTFAMLILILNLFKKQFVFYTPINIPGSQMAATIPPFGTFIESDKKSEDILSPCSVFIHEKEHWKQYERMGLISFYYHYISGFIKYGRLYSPMEKEARKPAEAAHCFEKRNHKRKNGK